MPSTTVATGTFTSRKAADQAIRRLVSSGFARNSIELHHHDDDEGFDVEIHTRRENVRRAEKVMHDASLYSVDMNDARRIVSGAAHTVRSHPALLLGAGMLAGFILYNLIPRSQEQPSHQSRTAHKGEGHRRRRA
ncbi:hypothetical protein AB4Y85_16730 [Microvirga sp. 2YAF29]|uniref:hypothetical protein n=1 Tax=Microvirga sp. 2YAF29 TaxID=3233031 RepID=UPI003F997491